MYRRAFLAVTGLAVASLSGCLQRNDSTPTSEVGFGDGSGEANPDHPIRVENYDGTARNVTVTVTRDGTEIANVTRTVPPGGEVVPYNLRRANPDGIEEYTVTATVGPYSDSLTVRTDDCYGEITVRVRSDGSPFLQPKVC